MCCVTRHLTLARCSEIWCSELAQSRYKQQKQTNEKFVTGLYVTHSE